MRAAGDFARGVGHALRGARAVLGAPRLWPLLLLPFVLSLAALAAVVAGAIALRRSWLGMIPDLGLLRDVLAVLAELALVLLAFLVFLPLASLIAAPFNEAIAEAVELRLGGGEPPPSSAGRLVGDLGRSLVHELRKLVRYLMLAAAIFLVSFLPVVGPPIALVCGGLVAARFAAYDALDATLSRWGWSYARKQALLRQRRTLCLGLGATVAALLIVPVVNALAIPLGAAGGASLALAAVPEAERRREPPATAAPR